MKNKPHKACDADLDKISFPIIIMPKVDGVRAIHINDEFTTRNLKPFRNERLEESFDICSLKGCDGELVLNDNPVSQSLCRDTTSFCSSFSYNTNDIDTPTWYLFDLIIDGIPYKERLAKLIMKVSDLQDKFPDMPIRTMPYFMAHSVDEVNTSHDMFITQGYEGTVLRDPDGMHKNGRCTQNEANFLRIKDLADEEAVILKLIEAQENNNIAIINELGNTARSSHKENKTGNGMIGAIEVEIPDGRIITLGAGHMTHYDRIHYWNNPDDIIGKLCTYKYMPHGEMNKRRHPRFKHLRTGDI